MILVRTDFVDVLGVPFGAILVFVVVDKDIPSESRVGRDDGLVARDRHVHVVVGIPAGLKEKCLVTGHGETASEGATTRAAAHDNEIALGV